MSYVCVLCKTTDDYCVFISFVIGLDDKKSDENEELKFKTGEVGELSTANQNDRWRLFYDYYFFFLKRHINTEDDGSFMIAVSNLHIPRFSEKRLSFV